MNGMAKPLMDLPELVKALLLGIVKGATEFIPVSSTGHLILVSEWLAFTGAEARSFIVFIQLGTIMAIMWAYRRRLLRHLVLAADHAESRRFLAGLAIAFVPAGLVGFLFHEWIKEMLFTPLTVSCALLAGGIAILWIERMEPATRVDEAHETPLSVALGIGVAPILALFPGVSRSGATIMGAYWLGLSQGGRRVLVLSGDSRDAGRYPV